MDPLVERVLARWAAVVVPFRPGVPTETIGGRRYVLSTDGGPLGDSEDPGSGLLGPEQPGGARHIHTPAHSTKWRFLWVYDTERHYVAMWRVSDGNEKEGGSDGHYGPKIVQLEKKGQLNRCTHQEFEAVEHEMRQREHALLQSLKAAIDLQKTDYQRQIDRLAREFFEKTVAPKLQRAVEGVKAGAIPLGFSPAGPALHDPQAKLRQALSFTVGQILRRDLSEDKVDAYVRHHGINPDDPAVDGQAIYWAVGDIQEEAYERFLPAR